jgi:hypothetical protein
MQSMARRQALPLVATMALAYLGLTAAAQVKEPTAEEALMGDWKAEVSDTHSLVLRMGKGSVEMGLDDGGAMKPLWSGKLVFPADHPERHFDWVGMSAGNVRLPDNKCLYKLAGDTLLVIGGGAGERPTRFLSGPGAEPRTLIFTRVKK